MKTKIAYISAGRIGHELMEIINHYSFARKNNTKLIIFLSPNVPNKYLFELRAENVRIIQLSKIMHSSLTFIANKINIFFNIFDKIKKVKSKSYFYRFDPDELGGFLSNRCSLIMNVPFRKYSEEYNNFELYTHHMNKFSINNKIKKYCDKILEEKLNIKKNNNFLVCLHLRDSLYLDDDIREWKNVDINNYRKMINYINSIGGSVVLMGTNKSNKVPSNINVIDYAHSEIQSGLFDMYLSYRCHSFIGCASGLVLLPFLLKKNTLLVNIYPYSFVSFFPNNMTLFKKVYSIDKNRCLDTNEILSDEKLCYYGIDEEYNNHRLKIKENDEEELFLSCKLFFESINNESIYQLTKDDIKTITIFKESLSDKEKKIEKTMFYPDAISKLIDFKRGFYE